jgi:hypothetical protein
MQFDFSPNEEGCFVFQVVNFPIGVRSQPSIDAEDKTMLEFEVGELVSIDLIQHTTDPNNGPYLRLADMSGWLFWNCLGQERMRKVDMERGLFETYVDNFPHGQYLRRHPVTSSDLDYEVDGEAVLYQCGTKLFCDAKVVHPSNGIMFYRVQGTSGWVFDQKLGPDGIPERFMLLPSQQVCTGDFCYQVLKDVKILPRPDSVEKVRSTETIESGQLVSVDYIRENPMEEGEKRCLRLSDGAGWLNSTEDDVPVLENVAVLQGSWVVQVCSPEGVNLRRHPTLRKDKSLPIFYHTGSVIQCDRKVSARDGTKYYRVLGTSGWIFDRRGDNTVLQLLSAGSELQVRTHNPWDPNFVRGIAATLDSIQENKGLQTSGECFLSFCRKDAAVNITILVGCKTRTVALIVDEACTVCEHNCTTKKLLGLFNLDLPSDTQAAPETENSPTNEGSSMPLSESSMINASSVIAATNSTPEPLKILPPQELSTVPTGVIDSSAQEEMELRKELLDLDIQEQATKERRNLIFSKIKLWDDARSAGALNFQQLVKDRKQERKGKGYGSTTGEGGGERGKEDLSKKSIKMKKLGKIHITRPRSLKTAQSTWSSSTQLSGSAGSVWTDKVH